MADNGGFDQPAATDFIVDAIPTLSFIQWVTRIHVICTSNRQSGVTADRPTSLLWIGRRYYDTTLNKPVFVSAVKPTVWRDAAGAVV